MGWKISELANHGLRADLLADATAAAESVAETTERCFAARCEELQRRMESAEEEDERREADQACSWSGCLAC